MSTVEKFVPHYTVEDYQHWEGRWELWEGYPVSMSPSPSGRHGMTHGRITTALNNAIDASNCNATVLIELDWIVADDTILRPDVMVVCGPAPEMHLHTPPAIVVEVLSPSTRDHDLKFKRTTYEKQGVPHYLILDPDTKQLTHLQLDSGGQYQPQDAEESVNLSICDQCELRIAISDLFK